jgi:K+-transporting ATPase KdpC subunit
VPDAANSGGSNLGPTSKALADRVKEDVDKLKAENPKADVPTDLVTTSASGLDPDISPEAALFQVPRVAKARNMPEDRVSALVNENTKGRFRRSAGRAPGQRAGAEFGARRRLELRRPKPRRLAAGRASTIRASA